MKLFNWLKGALFHRDKAMLLYRRGMAKANAHDHKAAIAEYARVIDMVNAPPDVRAMALYNRSVAHAANHDNLSAAADLEALLELPGAAANVKTEARRKLVRMHRTSQRLKEHPTDWES